MTRSCSHNYLQYNTNIILLSLYVRAVITGLQNSIKLYVCHFTNPLSMYSLTGH